MNQDIDEAIEQQLIKHGKGWRGINNPWMAEGDDGEEFQYINLVVNPERYTGYKVRSSAELCSTDVCACCPAGLCTQKVPTSRYLALGHCGVNLFLLQQYLLLVVFFQSVFCIPVSGLVPASHWNYHVCCCVAPKPIADLVLIGVCCLLSLFTL